MDRTPGSSGPPANLPRPGCAVRRTAGATVRAVASGAEYVTFLLGANLRATITWQRTGACPAVLAGDPSAEELDAVRALHAAYDAALRDACDAQPRCRHDDGAVAARRVTADEVSDADFSHPSVAGQRRLAELTWTAAFGG